MRFIFVCFIACCFVFSSHADSKIRRFQKEIKRECPNDKVSLLLLKKSLIELVKGEECSAKFTSLVINQCKTMTCGRINEIYKEIEQVRAGAVVGED